MECPKCGEKFRVINTASDEDTSRSHLRRIGTDLLSWYSEDIVVRHRVCHSCMNSEITVEVLVCDLHKIFEIISEEGIPDDCRYEAPSKDS